MSIDRNAVGWFEIYVQDMERARSFYEKVFDANLQHIPNPVLEMWAFPWDITKPNCGGAIVKMEGVPSGPGGTMVYFSCEDCAVQEALTAENGGQVVRPKMSIGEFGFISLVKDPDGNMFGLHSHD